MTEHTVEQLLAEIHDSEAREADYRNRAEVAEAKFNNVRLFFNSFKIGDQHLISIAADGSITYGKKHAHGEVDEHTESDEEDAGHSNQPSQARFSDVHIKPKVYKVEDGHPWKESDWPALREVGNCALCGYPETMHIQ